MQQLSFYSQLDVEVSISMNPSAGNSLTRPPAFSSKWLRGFLWNTEPAKCLVHQSSKSSLWQTLLAKRSGAEISMITQTEIDFGGSLNPICIVLVDHVMWKLKTIPRYNFPGMDRACMHPKVCRFPYTKSDMVLRSQVLYIHTLRGS
jgi:hypothetical protein